MRCRPGDLAIVVKSVYDSNLVLLVKVLNWDADCGV